MKNRLFKVICLLVIFLLCFTSQGIIYAEGSNSDNTRTSESQTGSNTTGTPQQPNEKSLELHAFYPPNIDYTPELEKYIDRLDSISFAWSRLYADSLDSLSVTKGVHGNYGFYYPEDYIEPIRYAKSKGKSIQLSIFADGYDVQQILPDENKRSTVIGTIISTLKKDISNGEGIYFDGVVIDFESLKNTDTKGNDILFDGQYISEHLNRFLNELNSELDKLDKKLYVAVNPKLYYDGYDYKEIIKLADKMIIMAHDYEPTSALRKNEVVQYTGYDSSDPIDSLAPIRKIKQALDDAKDSVDTAEELEKIWLQIAFDSSQWQYDIPGNRNWESLDSLTLSKGKRVVPTYKMIKSRIDNADKKGKGISYGYNNELQCPNIQYFNVSDNTYNVIIYEDSQSIKAKIDLVKAFNMGGLSLWSLGNIPDYNDAKGKSFHLDVWENIVSNLKILIKSKEDKKVVFVDKKLEEVVRERLDKLTGDIYKSDLEGIYRLQLPRGIKSMDDLKMFTNLEYLDAQKLEIKDIRVLSSLKNLRVLYLQRNNIADISPLKGLTRLQVLSLNGNKISDITSLSGLKELRNLYLSENQIVSIKPLTDLTKLERLNLSVNKIKEVSGLSKMSNLYELSMEGNFISSLKPLTKLNKLIYLNASNNKITDISPLKYSKGLESLYLQRNLIKDLGILRELRELRKLSLNGNQIKDIAPLSGLTKLTELYIKDNAITRVSELKGLRNLNTLYLGGNKITDLNTIKSSFDKLVNFDFEVNKLLAK